LRQFDLTARTALLAILSAALVVPAAAPAGAVAASGPAKLGNFRTCGDLTRYARRNALRYSSEQGLPVRRFGAPAPLVDNQEDGSTEGGGGGGGGEEIRAPAPQTSPAPPAPGSDFSGTNVQEEGVDEPDIVKTDGTRVFVASRGTLYALDVSGEQPRLLGSRELPGESHELLLSGDRLLVIAGRWGGSGAGLYTTLLSELDVSDPSAMKVVRTLEAPGSHVGSRLTESTARVVISSPPRPIEIPPPAGPGPDPGVDFVARQRRAIKRTRLRAWRPFVRLADSTTGRRSKRVIVPCRHVRRPADFSGLGMMSVLTIDLERGLPAVDTDGLLTDGHVVYGSPTGLYVATERWVDPEAPVGDIPVGDATGIHKFAATGAGQTEYRSSGALRGYLLSQWSMSEREGFLRVATTEEPSWWEGERDRREAESFVTVLEEKDGRLAQAGRVGGLGRGERIYAVRFIDDVGYVVTFRQTDPLYTVDLSDPANPAVLGELKILGYSAYLHPVGEDLLLGVGQDATAQGRTRGTQLSLFDVSDLRNPQRLHQRELGSDSSSEAEYDHRAFLYWPATKLAVIPVEVYDERSVFAGAIGFSVDRDGGIDETGRVQHDTSEYPSSIRRSLVVGDRLYTVSSLGVKSSRLDNLADVGWVPFREP
jgi:uncharacterized secreted protein with C-terminal beta-propeller domain